MSDIPRGHTPLGIFSELTIGVAMHFKTMCIQQVRFGGKLDRHEPREELLGQVIPPHHPMCQRQTLHRQHLRNAHLPLSLQPLSSSLHPSQLKAHNRLCNRTHPTVSLPFSNHHSCPSLWAVATAELPLDLI